MTEPSHDRWLFRYVYPLTAVAVVHIGNENSLAHLLTVPSYYSDLLLALLLSYAVGAYYHWWYQRARTPVIEFITAEGGGNLLRYTCEVLLLPVGIIIGIELIYVVGILGFSPAEASILYLELPLVFLFCLLINLIYVLLSYRRGQPLAPALPAFQSRFIVHGGAQSVSFPVEEIAYFQVIDKATFLVHLDGRRFLYSATLKELEELLDPQRFFTLNRQVIARRRGISGYERTDTRKLDVHLHPQSPAPVFVSKAKSAPFLRWLEDKPLAQDKTLPVEFGEAKG